MSTDLQAEFRKLILGPGLDYPVEVKKLLHKVDARLEWLELTNNFEADARLSERIETLEAEVKLLHECAATMRASSKVAEEARAVLASVADDDRRVRDTRKGEWPEAGQSFHEWDGGLWEPSTFISKAYMRSPLWLPAPPPPTED